MLTLSAPIHFTFELYPMCNNRCRGCGNITYELKKPFSPDAWLTVLKKIHPHAAHVRLSGGEPTLHPKFDLIVHTLSELDISFVLFTNGRWRRPSHLLHLLAQIPQFRGMLISLHSHVPEIHDAYTGVKESFTEAVQNIRKAVDRGFPVAASTILMPSNAHFIDEMVSFNETLGVCQTTFSRYVAVRNKDSEVDCDQFKDAMDVIEKRRFAGSSVEYSVCIPQCFKTSSSVGCLSGIAYCVIDPWGNVRPCTHVPVNCGNILKQSMEDIWQGPEMQKWRDMIPDSCVLCSEISKCRGGCRAAAFLSDNPHDPLMTHPFNGKPNSTDEKITLHEDMIPLNDFHIREEPFGYVLIRENRIVPVSFEAKPVLDLLNKNLTLRKIQTKYGDHAIDFIGNLYREGILEMVMPDLAGNIA